MTRPSPPTTIATHWLIAGTLGAARLLCLPYTQHGTSSKYCASYKQLVASCYATMKPAVKLRSPGLIVTIPPQPCARGATLIEPPGVALVAGGIPALGTVVAGLCLYPQLGLKRGQYPYYQALVVWKKGTFPLLEETMPHRGKGGPAQLTPQIPRVPSVESPTWLNTIVMPKAVAADCP